MQGSPRTTPTGPVVSPQAASEVPAPPAMAIVESSPEPGACPRRGAMGSVGSLLAGRPCHDRPGQAAGFVPARPAPPGPGPWGSQDPLLLSLRPKKSPASPCSDAEEPRGGSLRGPPPKLVPISGRLEKNVEKTLIRPTAFKPVVPKGRSPGGPALSDSQASLAQLFEKPGGPHSCRHSAHSGTLSDSGRNSLSSLPTYSTGGSHAEPPGATLGHGVPDGLGARGLPGPWASDSGRSSSSKSSGSLSGRGAPSSDGGSHGRSPGSGDEALLVRELEEKLREREAELRWLRESLEDEGAGGQVLGEPVAGGAAELVARQAGRGRRAQQVLQLQVLQLTQEKRQLQDDFAQLLQERELLETRCAALERQQAQLGPRLEETQWEVCQKAGEISLLKQQLKEAAGEAAQRGAELLGLRAQTYRNCPQPLRLPARLTPHPGQTP
ncbi:PREDICTED: leucine zipper putative tumor suppressor 2 [Crocodylus porosus]|uniref:leucine zipper putative tumor suppressor 2 n=1 Tax=Crocodylus porosus TaxID=8502 RepID=UPI00093933BD|nr:PREDICTED: leucine zipper putative tumor suppressor 2 [Crocodylus porosus]